MALKTIPAVTGAVDMLSHPLLLVESLLKGGSNSAADFAAALGTLQAESKYWTGGASIFGGPASTHQQQVKAEIDLVAAVETADAVGKNHLATLEANRGAITALAAELGSDAVPALQRYANELQKASDAAETKASEALARAAKQYAAAEKRLLAAAQAQHTESEHAMLAEAEAGAGRAARAIAEKVRESAADAKQAANEAFAQQQRNIEAAAQFEVGSIQIRARAKRISAGEELKELEAAYRQEYDQQVAALNAQLAALKSSDRNYLAEKRRLFDEIEQAHNRLQANLQHVQSAALTTDNKSGIVGLGDALGKSFAGLGGGSETMMRGVLEGTQRISVAWRRMGADMAASPPADRRDQCRCGFGVGVNGDW